MIDHRSSSRFSTGVPVSATRWPAVIARAVWAARVSGFLTAWASSSTNVRHSSDDSRRRSRGRSA